MIEQLRERPELLERFKAILGLTECADDFEDMLVEEARRLGDTAMREWAKKTEEKVARDFKAEHPEANDQNKGGGNRRYPQIAQIIADFSEKSGLIGGVING